MDLSNREKEIIKNMVDNTEHQNYEIYYGKKETWKNSDEKRELAEKLNKKGYIDFIEYSGTYKIHCKITEKALNEFGNSDSI